MFIQVIRGRVSDAGAARERLETWHRDLGMRANGWLGTTSGVTAEGEFVAVVRFEDAGAAARNSDRPEQGEWWAQTEKIFDGDARFFDYPNASLFLGGGSDDARFVQVIQGVYNGEGSPAAAAGFEEELSVIRSDVVGGTYAWDDDNHFTQTVYFTSEEAAREGEAAMGRDESLAGQMEEWMAQVTGTEYLDLTDPWMEGP